MIKGVMLLLLGIVLAIGFCCVDALAPEYSSFSGGFAIGNFWCAFIYIISETW